MKAKKMTQKLTLLTFTALFVAFMFNACSDVAGPDSDNSIMSEGTDTQDVFGWNQGTGGTVTGEYEDFRNTYTLIAGQTNRFGSVLLQKREYDLTVTARLDRQKVGDGWGVRNTHVWVGNNINDVPTAGQGQNRNLSYGAFPFEIENDKPYPAGARISFNLTDELLEDFNINVCPMYIVVHTSLVELDGSNNEVETQTGFADENDPNGQGQWWRYVKIDCETTGTGTFTGGAGNRR